MVSPVSAVLSTSLQQSLAAHASAGATIADPRQTATVDTVLSFKQSEAAAQAAIAVMKRVNETAERLLDIVV